MNLSILLVGFLVVSFGCKTLKKKEESDQISDSPNLKASLSENASGVIVHSLAAKKIDGNGLEVSAFTVDLQKIGANTYPSLNVQASAQSEYISYSLCQKNDCIRDYSRERNFSITGLSRISYSSGQAVTLSVQACVDPSHATDVTRNCSPLKEYRSPNGKALVLGKIHDLKLDKLLALEASKKAELKKNGQNLVTLVRTHLQANPDAGKSSNGEQSVFGMLDTVGGYAVGAEFVDSREKFVDQGMYLTALGNEAAAPPATEMPKGALNPFNAAQSKSMSGCFTVNDWNQLNDDERCRLIQGIFYNYKDINDCGLGHWTSGSSNIPRWFFASAGHLCSNRNNCNVYPEAEVCKGYRSNYGKGSCSCDPQPYYKDALTKFGENFNFRTNKVDQLNSYDKCISPNQVQALLAIKKTCDSTKTLEAKQAKVDTAITTKTAGGIVLGISGVAFIVGVHTLDLSTKMNQHSVDSNSIPTSGKVGAGLILGGLIGVVAGASTLLAGSIMENNAQDEMMSLTSTPNAHEQLKALVRKNTEDVVELRKVEAAVSKFADKP